MNTTVTRRPEKVPEAVLVPFYSPDEEPTWGQDIHVSLTTGHTAVIQSLETTDGQGTPLHPRFHREAVNRGALPVGAATFKMPEENAAPNRTQIIDQALKDMFDGNETGDFKRDGTPDLNQLMRRCGFRISREECDAAWAKVKM